MRSFLAAIQFLTVIPVHVSFSERDLGRSVMFFPLTGLLMGAVVSAADFCIKGHIFPLWLASTIDIVILAVLSGGLHLDGLADSADGLFSARPRDRMLEIMRDSRIGTMGVLALVMVLLIKIGALASLPDKSRWAIIMLAPLSGRCMIVACMSFFTYARKSPGLPQLFLEYRSRGKGVLVLFIPALAGLLLAGLQGLVASLISTLCGLLAVFYVHRKIGGYTGDTLGAVSEFSEMIVLAAAVAIAPIGL